MSRPGVSLPPWPRSFALPDTLARCSWATTAELRNYHDYEWGVPAHSDRYRFEMLSLEGAQAGLSWAVVLHKRSAYREAFHDFDIERVARMTPREVRRLLRNPHLVRHAQKMQSVVTNAQGCIRIAEEFGSFDSFIWATADNAPIVGGWRWSGQVPRHNTLSVRLSRDLRSRGFSFCGPVITYGHLQATGVLMDHLRSCFRYWQLV